MSEKITTYAYTYHMPQDIPHAYTVGSSHSMGRMKERDIDRPRKKFNFVMISTGWHSRYVDTVVC